MDENDENKATLDHALDSLPPDRAAAAAKLMVRYGVSEHDPAVALVAAVLDADAARAAAATAAQAAAEAAEKVTAATAQIPSTIYDNTVKAASDVRGIIGQEVKERGVELGQGLTAAIRAAADSGAAALRAAAADLPQVAAANQDAIVQEWRAALASAAKDEARGALVARMARSWGVVMLSLLLAASAGAAGMWGVARLTGHLTPWADPLATTVAGAPNCGLLRGQDGITYGVCLTQ